MSPRSAPLTVVAALALLATVGLGLAACTDDDVAGLPARVPTGGGPTTTAPIPVSIPPCDEPDHGVGAPVPAGARPGDLLAATELDGQHRSTAGFPTNAHAWRIAYVSTGVDEHDLQVVCGMAAAPSSGPASFPTPDGPAGRMLAWAHGTSGLQQACLPSLAPETSLWGKMADGINAVAWGSGFRARNGDPADGALQTALDRGWVVSATDYQPNDTYVVGRIAAANVIDAARATTELMRRTYGAGVPDAYDTITWGHSQGGHAAIWAGQLMDTYQAATPNRDVAELRLAGVAALAPASNFVVQSAAQGIADGNGLADWEMHTTFQIVGLPVPALELQIGPVLFSYIFGSWSVLSSRGAPAEGAATPAFPRADVDLDLRAITTSTGEATVAAIRGLCTVTDAREIQGLVSKYRNAAVSRMLVPDLWNLPDGYSEGEFFKGGTDRTCATTSDAGVTSWCNWIRWNLPGPDGVNPFPKLPEHRGRPVPVLIGQGMADEVIHCQAAEGAGPADVPAAGDCMSVALFDSLRDHGYCPTTGTAGHLQLALFRPDGAASPAGHLAIPGQISAAGDGRGATDLTFTGSPMERFMAGAFDKTLPDGCTASVLNP